MHASQDTFLSFWSSEEQLIDILALFTLSFYPIQPSTAASL